MIAQSVAGLLADHFRLTVEGIDRMYLNVYVPWLQCAYGAVSFFRDHRGQQLASSVLMSPMSRRFVAALEAFVAGANSPRIDLSPLQPFSSWEELSRLRADPPEGDARLAEGLMLKRWDSIYEPGRPKGPWFKWKRDLCLPHTNILPNAWDTLKCPN